MPDKAMGRLLPFARSAEEVRGLANRQQAHGNPVKALELLRLSLAKAPEDKDTLLAMAETYASIGWWTLSNNAFFSLIQDEEYAAASFYNLGVNFSTMQVDSLAHDCLVLSIQKDPEGDHVPDAVEMLDSIDEAHSTTDPLEIRIQSRMERVLTAMDAGNAQLATRLVRRVLSIDKHNSGVHSIHSFALLASGDVEGALKAARKAYKLDHGDVRALCAMASALHASQSKDASRKYLERALALIEQPDEAQLVCQTACESGQHDIVVTLLQRVEHNVPYSDEVLYPLSIALYNSGETEEAMRRWRLMRRIDPMDTVVSYWLEMAEEGKAPGTIPYSRQVPLSEILLRLENLRIWVHEGNDKLKQRWRESDTMEALVRWGLACGEQGIPQAMCSILASIGDEKAQAVLCEVLYDINIPHDLKHTVLAALHTMGAEGPFHAVIEDRLTVVHVSRVSEETTEESRQTQIAKVRKNARRWLSPVPVQDQVIFERLCKAVVSADTSLALPQRAKAVVVAYCLYNHKPLPLPTTYKAHRKVKRLATGIIKEIEYELH